MTQGVYIILLIDLAVLLVLVYLFRRHYSKKSKTAVSAEYAYQMELITVAVQKAINAFVITDADGFIRFWNNGAENMFGWTASEVIGKDLSFLMSAENFAQHSAGMRAARYTTSLKKFDRTFEQVALHRLGGEIHVAINVSEAPIQGVIHYAAIIKNINERKAREIQQRNELELLNLSEKIMLTGAWSWLFETNRVICTDGFNRIFETDDHVSDVGYLMKRVYYLDREMVQKEIDKAIQNRSDYQLIYRVQRIDGEPIPVMCKARIIKRANGTIEKIVGVVQKLEKGV